MSSFRASPVLFAAALLAVSRPAHAASPLPVWYGEENTTYQTFLFSSADLSPAADIDGNPYGEASADVTVGFFGNGWEDPGATSSNPGHEDDGAWDVGPALDGTPDGLISFNLPVAPELPGPGQFYRIDLMVYAIAYSDLQKIPVISVVGLAPEDVVLAGSGVLSTQAPAGSWEYRLWTGTLENYTGADVSFTLAPPLNPPAGAVSVIDRVEVFTRYTLVPEPSVALLCLLPGFLWIGRRRRVA